jgi:hypothetical protein
LICVVLRVSVFIFSCRLIWNMNCLLLYIIVCVLWLVCCCRRCGVCVSSCVEHTVNVWICMFSMWRYMVLLSMVWYVMWIPNVKVSLTGECVRHTCNPPLLDLWAFEVVALSALLWTLHIKCSYSRCLRVWYFSLLDLFLPWKYSKNPFLRWTLLLCMVG